MSIMTEEESGIKEVINEARLLKRVNAGDSHCHLSVDVITEYEVFHPQLPRMSQGINHQLSIKSKPTYNAMTTERQCQHSARQ